jgi:hypothetical protein
MTEHDRTRPQEPPLAQPASGAGPGPSVPDGPIPPASVAGEGQARRQREVTPWLSSRRVGWTVAAALLCAVVGLSVALALSPSGAATKPVTGSSSSGGPGAGGSGSNARSGPAAGGAAGTVTSVSGATFTMATAAGQKVTVDEASGTTVQNSLGPISASAVTTGTEVLVLGTADGTTLTATQVLVQPAGGDGSAAATAAGVIPFQPGTPTTSKQVGQIPADYTEGTGTIVSGTAANLATQAALAAYPGGVVDRVVQLGTGEYEVHYIGVSWPHHIFVDQGFTVVGAD